MCAKVSEQLRLRPVRNFPNLSPAQLHRTIITSSRKGEGLQPQARYPSRLLLASKTLRMG